MCIIIKPLEQLTGAASNNCSPGTSKKNSCGFFQRRHENAIAGAASNRAAPAATPPAISPVRKSDNDTPF
jgi:hypothetical protein